MIKSNEFTTNPMSKQNLYLKQISCLKSPINNHGWNEILSYYPACLDCLVESREVSEPEFLPSAKKTVFSSDLQSKEEKLFDEPIVWCTSDGNYLDRREDESFQLKRFVYDCSYLSPFVSNVYMRENSTNGWYRWVGPDPILLMRLPLAPAESENWVFTATFHTFLDEEHSKNITFKVNERRQSMKWVKGLTYQANITSTDLYGNVSPRESALSTLSISIPEARKANEPDQRMLAFSFFELSLIPV